MIDNNVNLSVEELKSGNREVLAKLVEMTSAQIYRMALRIVGNEQDAEDVLQETYIKAIRSLPDFEGRSSITTWLHRIAVNEALMLLRKGKSKEVSIDEDSSFDGDTESEGMEIVDFCCLPEGELLSTEARQFLEKAVQALPESLRVVFVLRDQEGLSIQEAARALNLSENNVKTRLLRARLRLRQELSVYFGGKDQEEHRQ